MLQIGNTLLSLDLIEKKFACDFSKCHGLCCEVGDSGAPLDEEEAKILETILPDVAPYIPESGKKAIAQQGTSLIDGDGDLVTPLVNNKECAFTVYEEGNALCAIEKAYEAGEISFQKPISCQLYPIRVKQYEDFEALNYDQWSLCKDARILGEKKGLPVYKFLKKALIRKYGQAWYQELDEVATTYLKEKEIPKTSR